MTLKPRYTWWIILALVVVATTLGGCLLHTYQHDYVRTSGTAYTWTDVPRYNGRTVYFNRYGKPMVRRAGSWYYVPHTATGIRYYRVYQKRVRLCRSGVRNAYYTRYCRRSAFARRVYVRNRYRSRYRRSYPRTYRTHNVSRRPYTYRRRTYRPRKYSTRRSTTTTRRGTVTKTRRYRYLGPGRRYDSSGRYRGRTDKNGRRYDSSGRYKGRTDKNGRMYDASGRYKGRVTKDGRIYDSSGRYKGRVRR